MKTKYFKKYRYKSISIKEHKRIHMKTKYFKKYRYKSISIKEHKRIHMKFFFLLIGLQIIGSSATMLRSKTFNDAQIEKKAKTIKDITAPKPLTIDYTCPQDITKLDQMRTKWVSYRLGDAIRGWYFRTQNSKYRNWLLKYYEKFGNSSLVTEYFTLTSHPQKFNILWKVVKPKVQPLPEHTAVVHLRLGDTNCIECWNDERNRKNPDKAWSRYVYSRTHYEEIIRKLAKTDVSTIIITASTYHSWGNQTEGYKKGMRYVKLVNDLFTKHGYRVQERINCGTPDEDFIFMSSAKYFVPAGGGFSKLVAKMVKKHDGRVYIIS